MATEKLLIIGIHGLANKPNKATLKGWWEQSIKEGLKINCGEAAPKFDFKMVHWAGLLYKNALHDDKNFNFDKLYNNEPYITATPRRLKEYKDSWRDELRRYSLGAGGFVLDQVKSHFGVDAVANWILEKTLKDLAFYYDPKRKIIDRNKKVRTARKVLMDELKSELQVAKGRRTMLIAHSMGSIIAYDVLRDLGRTRGKFDIDHFVTIGSPLGLPHVKSNIYEERKGYSKIPIRTPSLVSASWANYADRKDPVALDSHLSDDYKPNKRGIQVADDLVSNDYLSPAGESNHHKSYGYLRTPELSKHIADKL
ncbi:hypothetical protein [Pelagibius sp. Alg239-R121]|uniref:hypothetical protein n=1 Tax=Pelagibius sp. Alg239-R121 TaxID=2993448 RepID=UPI0024A6ED09|nr:hypothetical protein [Pelagibius sp. Alg239-R121]